MHIEKDRYASVPAKFLFISEKMGIISGFTVKNSIHTQHTFGPIIKFKF